MWKTNEERNLAIIDAIMTELGVSDIEELPRVIGLKKTQNTRLSPEERLQKLRTALEAIENLGAEYPEENVSYQMFRLANDALKADDTAEQSVE